MKKILVVEDDNFLLNVYQTKLEKQGFESKFAKNGKEVFEILREYQPDLIILDLMIPKMNGFDVLKKLKGNNEHADIPVIVVTNLSQDEEKQRVNELGAKAYFVKSEVNMQNIIEKIQEILSV